MKSGVAIATSDVLIDYRNGPPLNKSIYLLKLARLQEIHPVLHSRFV